jgi:hypothetical protein
MSEAYKQIITQNLDRLYASLPADLSKNLPAELDNESILFPAFGSRCRISPEGVFLDDREQAGAMGIILSLYALHASGEPVILEPYKSFRDFPNSAPYTGAFTTHTEKILVPHVEKIHGQRDAIIERFNGEDNPGNLSGDSVLLLYPLPKIALCYIFYRADEEFPATATCLYSSNATSFLPLDVLADVGEYTSKRMLEMVGKA